MLLDDALERRFGRVILASQSPRRRELMGMLCANFSVLPADVDETVPDGVPILRAAEYTAKKKAAAAAAISGPGLVIGCDTVVIADGRLFGKPTDAQDAYLMLKALSGKTHQVVSGVALCFDGGTAAFQQTTSVTFYPLAEEEISAYIESGEPFDKAGAYGIQGLGGLLVERIDGDYYNVVGLPVARLRRELKGLLSV